MRRRHLLIAAPILAILLLLFLWPEGAGTSTDADKPEQVSDALQARREARAAGQVSNDPASVAGVVVDGDTKEPVAGATISLTLRRIDGGIYGRAGQSPTPLTARTDQQGAFVIDELAPGRYSMSATKDGYKPRYQDGLLIEGGQDRSDIQFELFPGGHTLSGVVSDIGGGPVGYALVRARKYSEFSISTLFRAPFSTMTDANGEYQINLEDGTYQVEVFHADYRKEDEGVTIGGQDRKVDFVLTPGSVIEGVVLRSSDNAPVPGATVTWNPMGQAGGFTVSGINFNGGAETDAKGRFTMRGLGSGAFELRAVSKHSSSRQPTIVELAIAESISDITVYVDAAYTISGFVVNKGDQDQAESDVMVGAYNFSPGAVFAANAPSASDGYFEIHGVHPGTYTVGAAAEERQPNFFGETITIENEDIEDLVISVDPGNTLVGRIEPPQVARLTLQVDMENMGFSTIMQSAGAFLVNARSDENGEFTLKGVGEGTFTITAIAESGDEGTLEVEVAGDRDNLVVAMEPRAAARGIVVDEQGHAVAGATIEFEPQEAKRRANFSMRGLGQRTITGEDGRFEHLGLSSGKHYVTVSDGGQLAWAGSDETQAFEPKSFEVEDGRDLSELRLVVETRAHRISGSVLGPDGAPLPDAWVTAQLSAGPEVSDASDKKERRRGPRRWSPSEAPVLTDASGHFEITELRSGHYDLSAEGLRGAAKGTVKSAKVDTQVTIRIESLGLLTGSVTHGGAPLSDYIILVEGPVRRRVHVVRDNGVYRLPRLEPGEYSIKVTSTEGSANQMATVASGEETVQNLKLANFGGVTGTLLDARTGEPLEGIAAVASMGRDGSAWAENAMELMMGSGPRTDEEGRFRVGKLSAGKGELYLFDPKAKGFQMIATQDFELEPGENKELGEINGVVPNRVPDDKRGTLGLRSQVATLADSGCAEESGAEDLDAETTHLWIVEVEDDGAADEAGVKKCDRVTSVQGMDSRVGPQVLRQLLEAELEIGTTVTLAIVRKSGPTTLSLTAAPEAPTPEE